MQGPVRSLQVPVYADVWPTIDRPTLCLSWLPLSVAAQLYIAASLVLAALQAYLKVVLLRAFAAHVF